MDPLSITAASASLIFTCAKVTKCFHAIKDSYQNAPATVLAMISECATVSASLSQIQSLSLKNPVALSSRMTPAGNLFKNFDDALTGCMLTLSIIEEELEGMVEGDRGVGTAGFKARAKFVWNEGTMTTLLQQIRGQQAAIGLLVVVLQTESISEVKDMVQKNTATLRAIAQRARALKIPQTSRSGVGNMGVARPESIFSFGMTSTVSIAPDLNEQLNQSAAYRRAHEVEMEDLWKRNHELLQEKYTLLEKVERLEEQELVMTRDKEKTANSLQSTTNELHAVRIELLAERSRSEQLEAKVQNIDVDAARRVSACEASIKAAIENYQKFIDAARSDKSGMDRLETRRTHTDFIISQEADGLRLLNDALKAVKTIPPSPEQQYTTRAEATPFYAEPAPERKPFSGFASFLGLRVNNPERQDIYQILRYTRRRASQSDPNPPGAAEFAREPMTWAAATDTATAAAEPTEETAPAAYPTVRATA